MSNYKTQMTEKELDQVSGGPVYVKIPDMTDRHNNLQEACANGTFFRGFSVGPVNRLANVDMQNSLIIYGDCQMQCEGACY